MLEKGQAEVVLYYDTCEEFGLELGSILEQEFSPLLKVQSRKILGGASPLLPILEIVLTQENPPQAAVVLTQADRRVFRWL